MPKCNVEAQKTAQDIISGTNKTATTASVLDLVKKLKGGQCFGDARKLLGYYRTQKGIKDDPQWSKLTQEYSLCTYKDVDLLPTQRFELALAILGELGSLATTRDQETLGQAGAIFKNKWEIFNQKADLERSMSFYLRGYQAGYDENHANGYGYTGINAAFLLDLLGVQENAHAEETGSQSDTAQLRVQQAAEIRKKLIDHYNTADRAQKEALDRQQNQNKSGNNETKTKIRSDWWEMITWAEACFGLALEKFNTGPVAEAEQLFDDARKLLEEGRELNVDPWQVNTSAKQFVNLSEIHASLSADPKSTLAQAQGAVAALLSDFPGARDTARIGKVGLALSGGGFRASLFHIGVLARLAESDVLRHVEVISCVSGGSILGAHYYLELRNLLQTKADKDITQQDYIDLVARVEKDFLAGVQKNLRTKGITSLRYNLKAALSSHYTITDYMGKLYETQLYSRVHDGENKDKRFLSGLYIKPPDEKEGFYPRQDNWKRRNKVPMLVLNATALNTGHTWQFTASWMGEPPVGADAEVDRNFRLRRVYYDAPDLPDRYHRFPLGRAVAASSCVPGLFEPVELEGLYTDSKEGDITVQLVDGGVHDNQGTSSLLEENCAVILVSDASGQMVSETRPKSGTLDVPLRSNSILQSRVREAQFEELAARKRSSLLRGLMFLHLKKDLDAKRIDWVGHKEPPDPADRETGKDNPYTTYGVDKTIQHQLSATRTDLDSFSDTEGCALMCSGYAMADEDLEQLGDLKKLFTAPRTTVNWRFLTIMPAMKPDEGYKPWYDKITYSLNASCQLAGKPWRLAFEWCITVTLALLAIPTLAGLLIWYFRSSSERHSVEQAIEQSAGSSKAAWIALSVLVALIIIVVAAAKSGGARRKLFAIIMIPGSVIGMLHRHLYDKHFLRIGSLKSFGRIPVPVAKAAAPIVSPAPTPTETKAHGAAGPGTQ